MNLWTWEEKEMNWPEVLPWSWINSQFQLNPTRKLQYYLSSFSIQILSPVWYQNAKNIKDENHNFFQIIFFMWRWVALGESLIALYNTIKKSNPPMVGYDIFTVIKNRKFQSVLISDLSS